MRILSAKHCGMSQVLRTAPITELMIYPVGPLGQVFCSPWVCMDHCFDLTSTQPEPPPPPPARVVGGHPVFPVHRIVVQWQRPLEGTRSWPVTGVLHPELINVHLEEYLGTKPPVLLCLSVCHCVPVRCGQTRNSTPDHLSVSSFYLPHPPGSKFLSGGLAPKTGKFPRTLTKRPPRP
ncbi:hypothetical protein CRENBAI_018185 [Crenichthys baileyi]|uniref:Uncharacterized protein n=1 Tax=Crenichthys baileyi TaxID=28760 RepID=A0AAV9QTI6_9TELE